MKDFKELIEESLNALQKAGNNPSHINGISSGFGDVDKIIGGFENSDLIVIGGRPLMGKTAFLLSMALNMAEQNLPILFYSLEMNSVQLMQRILSNRAEIEGYKIKEGMMVEKEWESLILKIKPLSSYPLFIGENIPYKIEDFCKRVTEEAESTQAKAVFIDYLQLFSTKEKYQNRYEEISLCTRELKHLARLLNIPIFIGSQINRNPEHRYPGRIESYIPYMSDLRDSGTICEDANVVILLDRPEIHFHSAEDENGNDIRGLAKINVAKNHMGATGYVDLKFHPSLCKFEDWERFNSSNFLDGSSFFTDKDMASSPF